MNILREGGLTENDESIILFMCGTLKNDTNELIHKSEIDSKKTYGYQRRKERGRDKLGV